MGGSEYKATVLERMIKNLKKGLGGDYGVKMKPNRFHILCEVEWPPVGVGGPAESTRNLQIVQAVYTVVTGEPGHLDQYPYIYSWLGLASRPSYLDKVLYPERKGKNINGTKID